MRPALLLVLALAGTHGLAVAQDAPTVLFAQPDGADPVAERLREELVAMGVRIERMPGEVGAAAMEEAMADARAEAAVRVESGTAGVWLWLGAEQDARRIDGEGSDPATLALASAEVLRGHLVAPPEQTTTAEHAVDRPAEAQREDPAQPPASLERGVAAWFGPNLALSPGATPATVVGVSFGLDWLASNRLHLESLVSIGLPGTTITEKKTEEPFWGASLGLGAGYSLLDPRERFDVIASAGIALLAAVYRDDNRRTSRWAALPYLHLAGRAHLDGPVALRLDAVAAVAIPEVKLKLKGGERARFGHPLLTLSLGLELTL